ncbi:hypothetical protein DFJ77DRAFT_25419 [Powellomyces hirtus]|nr:hypothetical protein DFJ77DRAFT_25419 [Powellomyces hirtus]
MPSTPSTPDSVLRIRASLQGNGIGAAAANNAAAAAAAAAGGLSIEAPRTPDDMYAVSAARSQEYSHGLVPSFTGRVEDYAFPETTTVHRRLSTDLQASRALVPYCKTRGEGGGGSGRGSVSSNSGGGDQVYPPPPAPIVTNTSTRNQYRNHPYSRQTPAAPAAFTSPRGGGGQQTYQTHQLPTPTSAQYSPLEFADAQYYRHVYSQQQQQAQQLDAASQKHQVAAAQQPDQQTQQLQQQQQQQSSPQQTTQSLHAPTSQAQQQQTQQSQQSAAQRLPPLRMAVSRIEDDSRWGTM